MKTIIRYPGGKSKAIDKITSYVIELNDSKIVKDSHEILIIKRAV